MTPRTKKQNEEIRLRRLVEIRKAAVEVYLEKGPFFEIRDVATYAGLGYGTVYHYYSNKSDLLYDLLWDALERLEEHYNMNSIMVTTDPCAEEIEIADQGYVSSYSNRLLQIWTEDRAIFLLFQLAMQEFDTLPSAHSISLIEVFRNEVLNPLASKMECKGNEKRTIHQAEMLIASLVGCASLSIRRGNLQEEASDIVLFLKL